jgi:hypothetical protein
MQQDLGAAADLPCVGTCQRCRCCPSWTAHLSALEESASGDGQFRQVPAAKLSVPTLKSVKFSPGSRPVMTCRSKYEGTEVHVSMMHMCRKESPIWRNNPGNRSPPESRPPTLAETTSLPQRALHLIVLCTCTELEMRIRKGRFDSLFIFIAKPSSLPCPRPLRLFVTDLFCSQPPFATAA